ncbi:MAG: ATP-binding cassette domain-containing protein [Chthoniobacteraceae bacterium]|nr:ATP-binding cassette domain-containing protein [Chthoniobacteraceae bacterium]
MESLLARNVTASRRTGSAPERIEGLTLGFEPAALHLLFGPPGSGRNLLLRLLGLLERPEAGEIVVTGASTQGWDEDQCAALRDRHFGFVFETPLLLPGFNVAENIAMPFFKTTEATPEEAREATRRVLTLVDLADEAATAVEDLSLEAQQRVALARALVLRPQALFVENLDTLARNSTLIGLLDLLAGTRRAEGCCIIATAASSDLVRFADRAVQMAEGRVVRDWKPGNLLS